MNSIASETPQRVARIGWADSGARHVVTKQLARLDRGAVTLHDATGATEFGTPSDLHATLHVHRARFFRQAVLGGTLSVAESYLQGDWDCDDLTRLIRIFIRNSDSTARLDGGLARLARVPRCLFHRWHANTRAGSRRNIRAHYDLGNDFFRLWLDDTMAYSCGVFRSPNDSLRDASLKKFDRVCRRLDLSPDDDVLEIGGGWGGFALHAAKNYGCEVTTTTISREQFSAAEERIQQAGLSNRIRLLQSDYRDLRGHFDKLVSIEMIEAVGHRYLDRFFRKCGQLLRPDGSMMLQAIVMPDQRYKNYLKSVDFIQHYIFPGGSLPSLGAMLDSVGRTTDMRFVGAVDLAPHYAETLRRWRSAFQARLAEVRRLGFSDQFIRLWNYYFCYCEAAFEERHVGVVQIQFDKPERRGDRLNGDLINSATIRRFDSRDSNETARREFAPCGK